MIGARERALARDPAWAASRAALVTLLTTRAATYGRIEDYDRAVSVAEEGVRQSPGSSEVWLARASARAALHRFGPALEDLDHALRLGADADAANALRASVALARGDAATARVIARQRAERQPDLGTLSALGVVLAETGDAAGASTAFQRALDGYQDTSALAVAFVEFRQGLLAETTGELARAEERYRAVLHRLPGHAQAALHLASMELALGTVAGARSALETLVPEASDPEIASVRAEVARREGNDAESSRYLGEARAGYRAALALHPEAFADHAARFFLDHEPAQALRWARLNLDNRATPAAYDLALTAALRSDDGRARCELGFRALQLRDRTPRLETLTTRALEGCGRGPAPARL
jgi:tetratricopeptide (TPR) repeat protein